MGLGWGGGGARVGWGGAGVGLHYKHSTCMRPST